MDAKHDLPAARKRALLGRQIGLHARHAHQRPGQTRPARHALDAARLGARQIARGFGIPRQLVERHAAPVIPTRIRRLGSGNGPASGLGVGAIGSVIADAIVGAVDHVVIETAIKPLRNLRHVPRQSIGRGISGPGRGGRLRRAQGRQIGRELDGHQLCARGGRKRRHQRGEKKRGRGSATSA